LSIAAFALCARSVFRRSAILLLAPLALSCAPHQTATGEKCGLRGDDSSFAATGAVFRDCAVDQQVRLSTSSIRPDWTPSSPVRSACYFVELEFVVDTMGRAEMGTARAIRSNDRAFAEAWLATLNQWKYTPAQRAGAKVRQIVTEHRSAQIGVVVVPSGSPPPARPPVSRPAC
jgi:hypothetical protein